MVIAIGLVQCAVDLGVEADDAAATGIGDEANLAALARLESGCGAGRDVEATAARRLAVELQRGVGFEKMGRRADLDRPGDGIGDGNGNGRATGIDLNVPRRSKQLAGDHGVNPLAVPAQTGMWRRQVYRSLRARASSRVWVPAFAGVTTK